MKISKILAIAALTSCLTATTAFAQVDIGASKTESTPQNKTDTIKKENKDFKGKKIRHRNDADMQKDPIKALENKKVRVKSLLKEGKITKEEADRINARIDSKIKEIKEFNKLPLEKKKEKLLSDFKVRLEQKVKDGKISKDKMDEILKQYTEKINNWDGSGYPGIHCKGMRFKSKPNNNG